MRLVLVIGSLAFAMGTLVCAPLASGLPQAQWKPTKSDADIKKIGHRGIGAGLDFYSLDHEKELGKQLASQVARSSKFVDAPAITSFVDRLGQTLAEHSDAQGRFSFTFQVIDSDEVNAFTLPGGYQYVTRGLLLRVGSEGELAGILAHGIAHTALRTGTMEATKAEITQIAIIPAICTYGDQNCAAIEQGQNLMIPLTLWMENREYELAADYLAVQYIYVTGYDPQSYVNFIERAWPEPLAGFNKDFSPYPPKALRIQKMRDEIAKILPKRDSPELSTPGFSDFQEQVRAWKPVSQEPLPVLRTKTPNQSQ